MYGNNLYFQASPTSLPVQVTFSGDPVYVFNGVPDWLYEGYCYSSLQAKLADITRQGSKPEL